MDLDGFDTKLLIDFLSDEIYRNPDMLVRLLTYKVPKQKYCKQCKTVITSGDFCCSECVWEYEGE